MSARLGGRFGYPPDEPFKVTFHPDKLDEPTHWRKPQKVFVCSMGDLFHEDVTGKQINEVWNVAMNNRRHTFMFLTKRPDRLQQWTKIAAAAKGWPIEDIWPDWMWLGVTAENQRTADERIPILLQIPAAKRFVSVEPMLGPVHLFLERNALDWVIAGPETGPRARPTSIDWVRDLQRQCAAGRIPFFDKKDLLGETIQEWPR
jgi:protein gp37